MKSIAIHSYKGGVGKTTIALLLAKYLASKNCKTCVIDFDFIGSGIVDLLTLDSGPKAYLDDYFLEFEADKADLSRLFAVPRDSDIEKNPFTLILNRQITAKGEAKLEKQTRLRSEMMGMIANEPHFQMISAKTRALLDRLKKEGFKYVIIDCHPGLGFVSETIRELTDISFFVTTPNRSDCFSFLKTVNRRKELDVESSFLVINQADTYLENISSLQTVLKTNTLTSQDARVLFPNLKVLGIQESNYCTIPWSQLYKDMFHIAAGGKLPEILLQKAEFTFLKKMEIHINRKKSGK
jgi:septum site-determining protein MinD